MALHLDNDTKQNDTNLESSVSNHAQDQEDKDQNGNGSKIRIHAMLKQKIQTLHTKKTEAKLAAIDAVNARLKQRAIKERAERKLSVPIFCTLYHTLS